MTPEEKQTLRRATEDAMSAIRDRSNIRVTRPEHWVLQTSNSFRRIGCHGDGDVLCGTKHPIDGHPDLLAAPAVLDYIVAAQPSVVTSLLDTIDVLEEKLEGARVLGHKIVDIEHKLTVTANGFVSLADAVVQLTNASNTHEMRAAADKVTAIVSCITRDLQEVD